MGMLSRRPTHCSSRRPRQEYSPTSGLRNLEPHEGDKRRRVQSPGEAGDLSPLRGAGASAVARGRARGVSGSHVACAGRLPKARGAEGARARGGRIVDPHGASRSPACRPSTPVRARRRTAYFRGPARGPPGGGRALHQPGRSAPGASNPGEPLDLRVGLQRARALRPGSSTASCRRRSGGTISSSPERTCSSSGRKNGFESGARHTEARCDRL